MQKINPALILLTLMGGLLIMTSEDTNTGMLIQDLKENIKNIKKTSEELQQEYTNAEEKIITITQETKKVEKELQKLQKEIESAKTCENDEECEETEECKNTKCEQSDKRTIRGFIKKPHFFELDGKLAYYGTKKDKNGFSKPELIIEGQNIEQYARIQNWAIINNKIAYLAYKQIYNETSKVYVYDGKETNIELQSNTTIRDINKIGEKTIMLLKETTPELTQYYVLFDEKYGTKFDNASIDADMPEASFRPFTQIGNKIAYTVRKGNAGVVVHGDEISKKYKDFKSNLLDYNGKLAYFAETYEDKLVIVIDGTEKTLDYYRIENPVIANKKLIFLAYKTPKKQVLVIDEKETELADIKAIRTPYIVINNMLAYQAIKYFNEPPNRITKSIIVYGDKEITEYDETSLPQNINEKLGFVARKNSKFNMPGSEGDIYVVYDGKETKTEAKFIEQIKIMTAVGDKVAYAVIKGNRWTLIYDGKELTKYRRIEHPSYYAKNIGGKLAYIVEEYPDNLPGMSIPETTKTELAII
ncbi:hypothetical protein HY486_04955 [Candidatus Woesearchaeota archaeon]|nr:hypothetical protein [Candidatus Woesearchaeota archaeon]